MPLAAALLVLLLELSLLAVLVAVLLAVVVLVLAAVPLLTALLRAPLVAAMLLATPVLLTPLGRAGVPFAGSSLFAELGAAELPGSPPTALLAALALVALPTSRAAELRTPLGVLSTALLAAGLLAAALLPLPGRTALLTLRPTALSSALALLATL